MPELAFVLAPGGNLFFTELVDALRDELRGIGVATSVHRGRFPKPRRGLVYALVSPHEYVRLSGEPHVPADALARTMCICAEQPGTSHFEENVPLARRAGAVFDLNRSAVAALVDRKVSARHLQLGYTARWDRLPAVENRDIDVLFMGCESDRRTRALAGYAETLWQHGIHVIFSDNSRPNSVPSDSFVAGEEKLRLLQRTKVLLNLHAGDEPYFEWLRIVPAMLCGCAVVTEHSVDTAPLVPGRHFLSGRPETLALLADGLLQNEDARRALAAQARTELERIPLRQVAEALSKRAVELDRLPVPDRDHPHFLERLPAAPRPGPGPQISDVVERDLSTLRRVVKDIRLELFEIQRRIGFTEDGERGAPGIDLVHASPGHAAACPRVSVLTTVYNYENHVTVALDSLAGSRYRDWELIVVDDASTDGSRANVRDWMRRHGNHPLLLVGHKQNRGLPHARNAALGFARGDLSFVLDADNEVLPHCLERLVATLDEDAEAAFAYGMLQQFNGDEALRLMNIWPWEPERFRSGNYIDAMALVRTRLLRDSGGYDTDRRLYGWEDFDLWCRFASQGLRGVLVPEILARYRSRRHSMISLTDVSPTEAFSRLIERYPALLGGVDVPL